MSTATSRYLQIVSAENVNFYLPGGFHPVHLNDTFKDGRYQVVHKLGYGAYGTVWLVHDGISKRYASLKILAAQVSDTHPEVTVIQHLQQHATGSGKDYVVEVFDLFRHSGPNGTHQCIVMEVLGPPISSDTEDIYPDELFPIDVAKRISAQVAHGLAYIHKAGIVHGDLHMGNILLHSPIIASWSSRKDVEKYLGSPHQPPLQYLDSRELVVSPHTPSYIVPAPIIDSLLQLCLSNPTQVHVKICDFSEAFIPTTHLNPLPRNTPVVYASPELIFGDPTGQPADIWALAVLIHTLISGNNLFPSPYGFRKEVITAMVLTLRKLPQKWWCKWEERSESFNEDGGWVGDSQDPRIKHFRLDRLVRVWNRMDEAEIPAFEELIRKMVRYEPGERASIDEVINWISQNGWLSAQGSVYHYSPRQHFPVPVPRMLEGCLKKPLSNLS